MQQPLVDRLREKPKTVRVQIAFVTALSVTAVIGLAWGTTLPMRLDTAPQDSGAVVKSETSFGVMFAGARANVAQLIGAVTTEGDAPEESTSGAYTVGAPEGAAAPSEYQIQKDESVVEPVSRREVLIGTTTSSTRE